MNRFPIPSSDVNSTEIHMTCNRHKCNTNPLDFLLKRNIQGKSSEIEIFFFLKSTGAPLSDIDLLYFIPEFKKKYVHMIYLFLKRRKMRILVVDFIYIIYYSETTNTKLQ